VKLLFNIGYEFGCEKCRCLVIKTGATALLTKHYV
jgi:hypothetical protein